MFLAMDNLELSLKKIKNNKSKHFISLLFLRLP